MLITSSGVPGKMGKDKLTEKQREAVIACLCEGLRNS